MNKEHPPHRIPIQRLTSYRKRIDKNVVKDLSWWHWALTVPLLAIHLARTNGYTN